MAGCETGSLAAVLPFNFSWGDRNGAIKMSAHLTSPGADCPCSHVLPPVRGSRAGLPIPRARVGVFIICFQGSFLLSSEQQQQIGGRFWACFARGRGMAKARVPHAQRGCPGFDGSWDLYLYLGNGLPLYSPSLFSSFSRET